ncbi:MAG: BRCT domain-containing protein [bacterium]
MKTTPLSSRKGLNYDRDQDLIAMYNYPRQVQKAIQEIQGIAGMIVYDGVVNEEEISFLSQWLKTHTQLATSYPLADLKSLFEEITKDGVVSPEERKQLFDFLKNIASGTKSSPVVEGIFAAKPRITFKTRQFLFTGEMEFGSREKAVDAVEVRGGIICNSCTQKTHYLIVGNLGSDAYKYGRFGTKIEKALTLQKQKKSEIQIVHEHDFVVAVMKQA